MNPKPAYEELEKRIVGLEKQVERYRSAAVKYQTLFDSFPHGITVSDERGAIIESNAVANDLLGITKEEHERRRIGFSQ